MVVVVEMNLIISAKRKFMHDQIPALIIGFDLVDSICVGFTATLGYCDLFFLPSIYSLS
jgi:hypothetical protein